ncbi:MAG: hypothetical protein UY79_C0015G0007 [Parcubacteria group bacterium GW2011_GWA2_53_21]|nr:MAG: hypothetical protein UY79_C0015G0007 [Parcubacteria group bacterium GW2011_GWA2_53_21]
MDDSSLTALGVANWHQPKVVLSLVGMLLLAGIITVAILRDRIVNQPQWQVNVVGQGKVAYQPDTAEVTIGVQVDRAYSAELAMKQLNDKMTKIIAAIKAADVSAEDSSEKLAKVVGDATKAGANQIVGINFSVSNVEELKQQAKVKAISDAKGKAGALADAAGVRLGKVVGWWENIIQAPGLSGYGSYAYEKGNGIGGGGGGTPTVPTGSQEIIVEITVNYKVK